jgi:glycosyltransferase involved in cell wall biosynthesis
MRTALIDIVMVTYNQAEYVEDAIQSVLHQQCSFPFRILISDDCSTDATYQVCQKFLLLYPDKITLSRNSANLGVGRNYVQALMQSSAKYIAILEGDDFFLDPLKLQKQVDLLESQAEIGLVHANYQVLFSDGSKKLGHSFSKPNQLSGKLFDSVLSENTICPATVCLRSGLLKEFVDLKFVADNDLKTVDLFLWLEFSYRSEIAYLKDVMSVYRLSPGSVSNNNSSEKVLSFFHTVNKILTYYESKFEINKHKMAAARNRLYEPLIRKLVIARDYSRAKDFADKIEVQSLKDFVFKVIGRSRIAFVPVLAFNVFLSIGSFIKQRLIKIVKH